MRKHLACLVALAFLLFVTGAMAQTSTGAQHQTTTTTTTTQQTTTTTGTQRTVEGCVMKEASDFFLIPARGNPIELQAAAGQDLSAHEGHKAKVRGVESSLSASAGAGAGATGGAAGAATTTTSTSSTPTGAQSSTHSMNEPAGSTASGNAGVASGTGNDLHKLATKQMNVANLDHVADSCPVNWNPGVSSKRRSSKQ